MREHTPLREQAQLSLKDVSKRYGTRAVLDQVTVTVRPGERAAVVGENGSGKSTLLRLIAGAETPDTGEVTVRFPGGTGHTGQTLAHTFGLGPAHTVGHAVDAALAGVRELERRLRETELRLAEEGAGAGETLARYGELLTAFEERGGYEADARVDSALHALGLAGPAADRDRPLGTLSGGEQARLVLACVLADAPELLLLDEPTNHLDRRAADWLAARLRAHRGTLVVVTHDRDFLEGVATTVLEVDRDTRSVRRYGDGWSGYARSRAAERRRREQEHREYLEELARTEEQVAAAGERLAITGKDPGQGFGKHRRSHEAKLSGRVRAARQRLERLRREPVTAPPEPLRLKARPADAGTDGVLAELRDAGVRGRLRPAALTVERGSRLLVTGPNGAGKSTLLRVLAGELAPDRGTVRHGERVRIGRLAQELPAAAAPVPLLTAYAAGRGGHPDEYAGELLALGLFREEDLEVAVESLSVGQRRRLELARLFAVPADLLLLDEPTNHLAPALVEEVEQALAGYAGAVVAVSHDRRFRAGFGGERLELSPAGR
jgi:macrolide transport system ATP-binding/permease protein